MVSKSFCKLAGTRRSCISISQSRSLAAQRLQRRRQLASNRLQRVLRRKTVKKRLIRTGLIGANLLLLVGVVFFVAASAKHTPKKAIVAAQNSVATVASPVDRLTSYDVAANVAKAVNLPEKTPIANQAQSAHVAVVVSASDTGVVTKPQVVNTVLKSWRDITEYTVVDGEDVGAVAQKFGVTSESIRWSNNLTANTVAAGTKLVIPPVNGIVHTVINGDTPQTLAATFHANADKIAQYNDAEQSGLVVGRRIIIPDGQIVTVAPARAVARSVSFTPNYGSNGYDWGWCTYYAAARAGAPGNWGNANTWAYYGRISGWNVSSTPVAGAIFQTGSGWAGHVGIVEEVYDNGTMKISDMNGIAGFGRVGFGVVPVNAYPNYIYR